MAIEASRGLRLEGTAFFGGSFGGGVAAQGDGADMIFILFWSRRFLRREGGKHLMESRREMLKKR